MDMKKQPGIQFKGIILTKENFSREKIVSEDYVANVSFDIKHNTLEGRNDANVEITTSVEGIVDKKQCFNLTFSMVGIFSYLPGEENMEMENFTKYNAPALMFPYIREHIVTITQKSGLKPLMLAPTNIVALLDEKNDEE